jgi:F-type H+-transporting ATPase subunit gamma
MPTLKEVQLKIQGVKKTKQITKAMNMVATSRLRGAQGAMDGFRPYAEKFSEVLGSLAEKAGDEASPLLIPKEEVKKITSCLVHLGSGIVRRLQYQPHRWGQKPHQKNPLEGAEYSFTCFGKKGRDWCRKSNTRSPTSTSGRRQQIWLQRCLHSR